MSRGGATDGRWRSDGREIFYVSSDRQLVAAEVSFSNGAFEVGAVRRLFALNDSQNGTYAVMADGRFLMLTASEPAPDQPLTLIQNWDAGVR